MIGQDGNHFRQATLGRWNVMRHGNDIGYSDIMTCDNQILSLLLICTILDYNCINTFPLSLVESQGSMIDAFLRIAKWSLSFL